MEELDSYLEIIANIRNTNIKCPLIDILTGKTLIINNREIHGPLMIYVDENLNIPGAFDNFNYICSVCWNTAMLTSAAVDFSKAAADKGKEEIDFNMYSEPLYLYIYTGPDEFIPKGKGRPVYRLLASLEDTSYLIESDGDSLESFVNVMRNLYKKCPILNDYLLQFVPQQTILAKYITEKIKANKDTIIHNINPFIKNSVFKDKWADVIIITGPVNTELDPTLPNIKKHYGTRAIPANKMIIAAGSEYFRRRFNQSANNIFVERDRPNLLYLFPEEDNDFYLRCIIDFLYGGNLLFDSIKSMEMPSILKIINMINYLQIYGLCNYFELESIHDKNIKEIVIIKK